MIDMVSLPINSWPSRFQKSGKMSVLVVAIYRVPAWVKVLIYGREGSHRRAAWLYLPLPVPRTASLASSDLFFLAVYLFLSLAVRNYLFWEKKIISELFISYFIIFFPLLGKKESM